MKIDGVDVVPGETYESGKDYDLDVLVLGKAVADELWRAKGEDRPHGVYEVTSVGSAAEKWTVKHGVVGFAARGHAQTLTLTAATVECRGESVTSDVSIRLSVNEHGHGSIAFKFTDVPPSLREAMREASERDPVEPFVPFAVVDGARCDVPALPWQRLHSAEEGPVSVTLYGENLRGLVPNFGPPVAVKVPGCRHSAQSWYRKDGVLGCDDCDAGKEKS